MDSSDSSDPNFEQIEKSNQPKKRLMPKKADFRMHAHINPLNETLFPFPLNHSYFDLSKHFPLLMGKSTAENEKLYLNTIEYPDSYEKQAEFHQGQPRINFLDIGCGFGGLLFALSKKFQDKLSFGMEIRGKVVNFVGEKIRAMRIESNHQECNNISVVRTNSMRHLIQYIPKSSIDKIFICFADPQFKKRNHRRRIVNFGFLSEYAYLLVPGGKLYCITDVKDLHDWHVQHISNHKSFRVLEDKEIEGDECIALIYNETEEGKKVARNGGQKYVIVSEKKLNQQD